MIGLRALSTNFAHSGAVMSDPIQRERMIAWAFRVGFALVGVMTLYILVARS